MPFPQLDCDVLDEEFIAGNRQSILGVEVREMRELVGEFVAQAWIGKNLPLTVAFAALHERSNECMLVVHGRSVAQKPGRSGGLAPALRYRN